MTALEYIEQLVVEANIPGPERQAVIRLMVTAFEAGRRIEQIRNLIVKEKDREGLSFRGIDL